MGGPGSARLGRKGKGLVTRVPYHGYTGVRSAHSGYRDLVLPYFARVVIPSSGKVDRRREPLVGGRTGLAATRQGMMWRISAFRQTVGGQGSPSPRNTWTRYTAIRLSQRVSAHTNRLPLRMPMSPQCRRAGWSAAWATAVVDRHWGTAEVADHVGADAVQPVSEAGGDLLKSGRFSWIRLPQCGFCGPRAAQ